MTKLEMAELMVKQDGSCLGVDCADCPFDPANCEPFTAKKAQKYINTHKFDIGTTLLVSNDNIHWKERELSLIHEGCYICHTNNRKGFKCWRYAKKIPKTETWYQYLYVTTKGAYEVTVHLRQMPRGSDYKRIDESAKEVEVA